ncbi:MAG: pentapeptide repeat-containing protein [Candidatus Promineifilaceae bacterium]
MDKEQYKKLHAALVSHFNPVEWRYILRVSLNVSRDEVVSAKLNARDMVTEIIDYVEDRGELVKLVQTAAELRPNVEILQELQDQLAPQPVNPITFPPVEARFNKMVADLGSDNNLAVQISAAAMLLAFLKPEYADYHNRVYYILRAQVKEEHPASVKELLVEAFELAVRLDLPKTEPRSSHDISRAKLQRVDLGGQDLSEADIAYANLQDANLEETTLFRARGFGVDLTKANMTKANLGEARLQEGKLQFSSLNGASLVAANLKRADLCNAKCRRAKLQSAHLEGSKLIGAQFQQADLNDAFFHQATFDDRTLSSILKAYNWRKAHFDDPIMAKLQRMAAKQQDRPTPTFGD